MVKYQVGEAIPNGWKWTEDKKVAQPLMEALEMYRKEGRLTMCLLTLW